MLDDEDAANLFDPTLTLIYCAPYPLPCIVIGAARFTEAPGRAKPSVIAL
ncbi:hypothetical protein [Acidiphilium sp.]